MADVHVVLDGCAAVEGSDVRAVSSRGPHKNWTFSFGRLVIGLPAPLEDRQMDWLEIHGAIYAADRCVERLPGLNWTRSIELHVPVREPEFWHAHTAAFQDIFSSLTYDRLHIHFYGAETFAEPPRTRVNPYPPADSVALLSGGMDSFVGGLQLLAQGRQPLFLAASGSGATHHSQREVANILQNIDSDREVLRLTAQRAARFPGNEQSQRTRSFLYASAASLVASALGVEDVYVNENGVMAVHVPMSAARIGSLSTRTASPRILMQMADLASNALEAPIAIRNLLVDMTKPEVAELGVNLGHRDDLASTVSCWSISHRSTHCGVCVPCITRRISCLLHDIPDVTYDAHILHDRAVLDRADAKDALTHLLELAQDFATQSDADLELDYPELLGGGPMLPLASSMAMYRRWANQALTELAKHPVPQQYM